MKKRNLLITNTYFQLITAINLAVNHFNNDKNDLILTDRSVGMKEVGDKLKKYDIFDNILYIQSKDICTDKNKIKKYMTYLFNRKKIIGNTLSEKYDCLLFFNFDLLTYSVFDELNKSNKNLICKRYEEGYIAYIRETKNNNINQLLRKLFFKRDIEKSIESLYLYHPDLLCYDLKYKTEQIKLINKEDEKLKEVYNYIFDYKKETIKQKYIFFEESFFCDNKDIDDLELVLKIAEIVGKENLLVKLHPRNTIDRFKKYGIQTNKTIGIPWEVIQMNNDFSDKVFFTISSGSVLASKLYFGDNITTYLLFNCTEKMSDMITEETLNYLEKMNKKFGIKDFIIPKNKQEFIDSLKEQLTGGNN